MWGTPTADEDKNKNIKKRVFNACKRSCFLSHDDIKNKSSDYIWVETVCNVHLMTMDILELLDKDDSTNRSLDDIRTEEKAKAKIIGEYVAKQIILSIPHYSTSKGKLDITSSMIKSI